MIQQYGYFGGLLLLCAVAFALYSTRLDQKSLNGDEKSSVLCAVGIGASTVIQTQPPQLTWYVVAEPLPKAVFSAADYAAKNTLANVKKATIQDNGNAFFYNLVLHYWIKIAGSSDFAVRLLSVVLALCNILVAYRWALAWQLPRTTALLFAACMAFHPLLINWAQMARTYTFTLLWVQLSAWALAELMRQASGRWALAYGVFGACAMMAHYLSVYVLMAQGLVMLFFARNFQVWRAYVAAGVGMAVVLLGWWYAGAGEGFALMKQQNQFHQALFWQNFHYRVSWQHAETLLGLSFQRLWTMFGFEFALAQLKASGYVLMLIFIILCIGIVRLLRPVVTPTERTLVLQSGIVVLFSLAWAIFQSLNAGHLVAFGANYFIFAVPFLMLILSIGFSKLLTLPQTGQKVIVGSLALAFAVGNGLSIRLGDNVFTPEEAKTVVANPFAAAAHTAQQQYQTGDTLVCVHWHDAQLLNLYLKNRPDMVQQVAPNLQSEKIYLKKSNGDWITLADLEGKRYGYPF